MMKEVILLFLSILFLGQKFTSGQKDVPEMINHSEVKATMSSEFVANIIWPKPSDGNSMISSYIIKYCIASTENGSCVGENVTRSIPNYEFTIDHNNRVSASLRVPLRSLIKLNIRAVNMEGTGPMSGQSVFFQTTQADVPSMIDHSQIQVVVYLNNNFVVLAWPLPDANNSTIFAYTVEFCVAEESNGNCVGSISTQLSSMASTSIQLPNSFVSLNVRAISNLGEGSRSSQWFHFDNKRVDVPSMINHSRIEYFSRPANSQYYYLTWPIPSANNASIDLYSIRFCEVETGSGGCKNESSQKVFHSYYGDGRVGANITLSFNAVIRLAIQAHNSWGASELPEDWFYVHTNVAYKPDMVNHSQILSQWHPDGTIELSWPIPSSSTPITSYVLTYSTTFSNYVSPVVSVKRLTSNTPFSSRYSSVVHELNKASTFLQPDFNSLLKIKIVAKNLNIYGESPREGAIIATVVSDIPDMINYSQIKGRIYGLNRVQISWPVPHSSATLLRYLVTYCVAEPLTGSCVGLDGSIWINAARNSTIISHVPPNSLLGLHIRAVNGVGQGELPNKRYFIQTARIDSPIISSTPTLAEVTDLQAVIEWPIPQNSSFFSTYVITVISTSLEYHNEPSISVYTIADTNARLTSLPTPYFSNVTVEIHAEYYLHSSQHPTRTHLVYPLKFQTKEGYAEMPNEIKVVAANFTSLELTWMPPAQSNGILAGYLVKHHVVEVQDISSQITTDTSIILSNLKPNTRYRISVQALTNKQQNVGTPAIITPLTGYGVFPPTISLVQNEMSTPYTLNVTFSEKYGPIGFFQVIVAKNISVQLENASQINDIFMPFQGDFVNTTFLYELGTGSNVYHNKVLFYNRPLDESTNHYVFARAFSALNENEFMDSRTLELGMNDHAVTDQSLSTTSVATIVVAVCLILSLLTITAALSLLLSKRKEVFNT